MKNITIIAAVLALALFGITACNKSGSFDNSSAKIAEFTASDMPDDDGGGVILKWKPLDKEHKIIKYNIYRGVSPDSLFLLTYLEVDPKLGVSAPELFYYDRGDQPLIEFETSPTKLKKEKNQPQGSPLYQKFPIDASLLGGVIGSYNVFATLYANRLYKSAKPVESGEDILAGVNLNKFESIYAAPMVGNKYYYSVLGVNERGLRLPAADVQSVVPTDDVPDATAILQAVYVSDKKVVNFEWSPPSAANDIAMWQGWLVPSSSISDSIGLPNDWQSNAIQLFEIPNMHAGATYYQEIPLAELAPIANSMESYVPVLAYADYQMQGAAVKANSFRTIQSALLPPVPEYKVLDKANDKGDNLLVSFGKPLAYITLADFTNKSKSNLKINYEISANELYHVDKVKFTFKTMDGTPISMITENYVDKAINLKFSPKMHDLKHIHAEMAVLLHGSSSYEPEIVSQELVYNDYFKRFQAQNTFINGVDITKLNYDVHSRSKMDPDFIPGLRSNALIRTYEHSVAFEDLVFKGISGYDAKTERFLINNRLGIALDAEKGIMFDVPLFRKVFETEIQKKQEEIGKMEADFAQNNADSLKILLEEKKAEISFITNHEAYKAGLEAKSDKAWLKTMLKYRDLASRNFAFKLLVTDGKAAFTTSEIYVDKDKNEWITPTAQWFDGSKTLTLFVTILLMVLVLYAIYITRRKEVYIRPIAGLKELDNAIGRATEMGRPVMFVPGWGGLGDVCTIASMMILGQIAKKTAEYDIRLISPHCDYMVLPMAQEIVGSSYSEMGRPDSFNQNDIFFVSMDQFPFCAGVNGITVRERVATIFYMGFFNAEALLLTETGNQAGAIQIAATDAVTQIPFFITTCDYTLIGEEFYAASAYLSRNHEMVSMLKAQDYFKLFIVLAVIVGTVLSTLHMNGFVNAFPLE